MTPNHKKLRRIYREENLRVRRRGGRKRLLGTRAPMLLPEGPNQRWSLDFVSDSLACGRRFRMRNVIDDYSRECLALVADTSLSGVRVVRELTRLIGVRGKPHTVVSDNGTELTSPAILRWSQERRIEWHYIAPASRRRTASSKALMVACATSVSTRRCSRHLPMPGSCSMPGGTITTMSGHPRNWAGGSPPRSPANISGGMPPDSCHHLNQPS